jgi:acyl-CoA synthetase (AMP-forming)/AMP-acid ligase II
MSDKTRHPPLRLQGAWSRLTLPSIVETAAHARPGRFAFTDAPDRGSWTDGAPRSITAGELQRDVSLFARKFATLGLRPGDRILVMTPNIVEGVTAILGVMLAGYVPCPLNVVSAPDAIIAAAEQVKAAAIVTVCRYAHLSPAQSACEAASRYYGIRFVAAFGARTPPGAISLSGWPDDDHSTDTLAAPQPHQTALVTFDTQGQGEAFARTHAQLIGEALALSAISGLTSRGSLLGTFTPVSAAGVIATLAAPLISGAHVHLHGPFAPETLRKQLADRPDAILILPSAAEGAVRGLFSDEARDTIVINREPAADRPAGERGRVTELLSLGEWATWSMLREPERRRCRIPRAYIHPVATALPKSEILIRAEASAAGRLTISGIAMAQPFGIDPPAISWESDWAARGDGPQHLAILSETPTQDSTSIAATIAA